MIIATSLSVSMLIQVNTSVGKVISKPTGTEVAFKEFRSSINMSVTICKVDYNLRARNAKIKPLESLLIVNNGKESSVELDADSISSFAFYWFHNGLMHICDTVDLPPAEEIQLHHLYGRADEKGEEMGKNMFLHIHERGQFDSGYDIMLSRDKLDGSTILLLDLEQMLNIPDPEVCSQDYLYDKCKEKYISDQFIAQTNCSLRFGR